MEKIVMSIFTIVLAVLVAIECVYIMYLETINPVSEKTAKTFGIDMQVLKDANIQSLLKNQGVYNGLLALGILYSLVVSNTSLLGAILIYIIAVAIYGGITVDKSIILKQGGVAILALGSLLLF